MKVQALSCFCSEAHSLHSLFSAAEMALLLLIYWVSRAQNLFMLRRNVSAEQIFPYCFKNTFSQSSRKRDDLKEILARHNALFKSSLSLLLFISNSTCSSVDTDSSLHSQLHFLIAEESGPTNIITLSRKENILKGAPG